STFPVPLFFLSSRRRHTRFSRDWSSDVCSSDLKPDPIPDRLMDALLQSLYLAPSGNNLPSREFIVVKDREMLRSLAPTTPYMKWLEQAAVGIVIIGRPDISKYWLQDASIAGGYAWLTAVSLGLGAAWGAVYHAEDEAESKRRE